MRLLRKFFIYVVEAYAVWSLRRQIRRYPMQDFGITDDAFTGAR